MSNGNYNVFLEDVWIMYGFSCSFAIGLNVWIMYGFHVVLNNHFFLKAIL